MASGKGHNPWLAKSRMFEETLADVRSVDYSRNKDRAVTLYWNQSVVSIPSCYFLPRSFIHSINRLISQLIDNRSIDKSIVNQTLKHSHD